MKKITKKIESLIEDLETKYIREGESNLYIYERILRLKHELDCLKKLIESK